MSESGRGENEAAQREASRHADGDGYLAATYRSQDRLGKTEFLQLKVMQRQPKLFGMDHSETLQASTELAHTYRTQWRLQEAEELHVRVVRTEQTTLGRDDANMLNFMKNLALTYWY